MKLSIISLCVIFSLTGRFSCFAQSFSSYHNTNLPQFSSPLPIPLILAGNYGECRPGHFHAGIDIRTNSRENMQVFAVEGGYVSRIKIEPGGYGNAVYVTHPGGYTSLYAHMNAFFPALDEYVRTKQYESRSWQQDIVLMPYQFPLSRGAFLGWSGNTGSSQGPHLHLEIRETQSGIPLNPLFFFNQIPDHRKPIIRQIALYDGNRSIYDQKPAMYTVAALKKNPLLKISSSEAYIGISGDDFIDRATATLGIYEMRMYVDGSPFFGWKMDRIAFENTTYVNAHADYKIRKGGGPWIQLCRSLPNDRLNIYKAFTNGVIDLRDGQVKNIRIEVLDTRNNMSTIQFSLKGEQSPLTPDCEAMIEPGEKYVLKNQFMSFTITENMIYDKICLKTGVKSSNSPYSHIYQLHYNFVPMHTRGELALVPKINIPPALQNKIAVVKYPYSNVQAKNGKAADWVNGRVVVNIKEFGDYEILIDEKAPVITGNFKNEEIITGKTKLFFTVTEETTSVKECVAMVDGQWLRLMQKGRNYIYEMDEHFPEGTHQLVITAEDENNNTVSRTFTLTK